MTKRQLWLALAALVSSSSVMANGMEMPVRHSEADYAARQAVLGSSVKDGQITAKSFRKLQLSEKVKREVLEQKVKDLEREMAELKGRIRHMPRIKARQMHGAKQLRISEPFGQYAFGGAPRKVIDTDKASLDSLTSRRSEQAITTSFLLGKSGSNDDLVVFLPAMRADLGVLRYRKKLLSYCKDHHLMGPRHPSLTIGGKLVTMFETRRDYNGTHRGDIDIDTARIDLMAEVNPWVSANMIIDYSTDKDESDPVVERSKLRLDREYLTIGNLARSPFYFSVGQMYAPFGSFSSYRKCSAV